LLSVHLILAVILIWNHRLRVEIDTRRKVEIALTDSQLLLREAQALAHVGNWELDPATMKAFRSDEVYRIFGIEYIDDAGPKCLETLLHPDDRTAVLASLQNAVKGDCKHHMEYRIIRPDGGIRWIDCEADQVLDENGEPIKLRGVIQDITLRKINELQLRESEERFELVLTVANDGIWDWHLKDDIVFFDERYYTMAGYEPNEFPGRYEEWIKRIHSDDVKQAELAVEEYLAGDRDSFDIEFMFRCKDDDYIWIRGRGKIVARDEQGNPVRFVGTHSDITQRKLVEEKIYDSEERYRTIIEGAPAGVWLIGPDRQTLQVNKCLCDMLGYQQEDIIGRQPMEFADEKNGYELAERAKTIRPDLKILLTSGYTEKVANHKAHAHVGASLIGKPYSFEEIANRIRMLLDDKRPRVVESFGGLPSDKRQPKVGY